MSQNEHPDSSGEPRRELYRIMEDDDLSLAEKQERVLSLGREYLDVENGHIERVEDEETHEIVASVGQDEIGLSEGTTLERATTYCRRTLERDSSLALSNAPEQGWADDPAYRENGLDCYLGATILVDGDPYGTVCFVSRDARQAQFSAMERAFVELAARMLGREFESQRHRRQLTEHEAALERSERRYESLMRTAPDAILLVAAESGEVVDANRAAADLLGRPLEELVGLDAPELVPPGDREQYQRLFAGDPPSEEPRSRFDDGTPLRVQHRDGTTVPVELSASTVDLDGRTHHQILVRDITDRREHERELRMKNRAIDEAPVGITIADATGEDLPLVYANRGFERLTGYDRDAVVGRNCRFLQGPETDPDDLETVRSALEEGATATTELLNYRADGTPFWNELTVAPVENPAGETTRFVGVQHDVTDRRRRERLIAVLNRVLRHNLRNDMNVVTGHAEWIADRAGGDVADAASEIADTGRSLVELSTKARDLETTARDPGTVEPRNVVSVAERVAEGLRSDHPDADVRVTGTASARAMATDRLRTALRELGTNAIEHAGEAPSVEFHVDEDDRGCVVVEVVDDGPGLPEMERRVLREGSETPLDHGNGLGLWLVNWLVTSMGGHVTVDGDDGTAISVHLRSPATRTVEGREHHRRAALGSSGRQ